MTTIIEEYWKESEAANFTGLSLSKLRQDRCKGVGIPYSKVGKAVRYAKSDVIQFMQARKIETKSSN